MPTEAVQSIFVAKLQTIKDTWPYFLCVWEAMHEAGEEKLGGLEKAHWFDAESTSVLWGAAI